jgi:hypothetical protein
MNKLLNEKFDEKVRFYSVCKTAHTPGTLLRNPDDPGLIFFQECQKEKELVLPLLKYIDKKAITLEKYKLSDGACSALSAALEYVANVNKIVLDRNGISDKQFAIILSKINKFRKIVYKHNGLGEKSLQQLQPLIQKNYLEELRVEHCDITVGALEKLLEMINDKNFLTSFSLVNQKISDDSLQMVCDFVRYSQILNHFSISNNKLDPKDL